MTALGYLKVGSENFGGKERRIFTEIDNELEDIEFKVIDTRQVVTGTYYSPSGSGDWYECGGLDNQKSNRILELSHPTNLQSEELWVVADNCERINNETD